MHGTHCPEQSIHFVDFIYLILATVHLFFFLLHKACLQGYFYTSPKPLIKFTIFDEVAPSIHFLLKAMSLRNLGQEASGNFTYYSFSLRIQAKCFPYLMLNFVSSCVPLEVPCTFHCLICLHVCSYSTYSRVIKIGSKD